MLKYRAVATTMLMVVGITLAGCCGGPCAGSGTGGNVSDLRLEWNGAQSTFHVGDDAEYIVAAPGADGEIQWHAEDLPANWFLAEEGASCRLTGPMMIGSTRPRDVLVIATDEQGNSSSTKVTIVANTYAKQVDATYDGFCGNPADETTRCYTVKLPRTFKRDPDRRGYWLAWIDTDGLRPGDQIWVFDWQPTKFDSEGQTIPGEVEATEAESVDLGETTEDQSQTLALSAIEDGEIGVRVKTPERQSFEIIKVEIRVH